MYTVNLNGTMFSSPLYASSGYTIEDGVVTLAVNTFDAFEFVVPSSHPRYDDINLLTSIFDVYDGHVRIFRGRVISKDVDFYRNCTVKCEPEAAYLCDSVFRPFVFTGSIIELLEMMLDSHNEQVGMKKTIFLGKVTVTDPNDSIRRESESAKSTWQSLNEHLLDTLGGYFVFRYDDDALYLDYLASFKETSGQEIRFAQNLLDLSQFLTADTVATHLIPYGARLEDGDTGFVADPSGTYNGNRLTLSGTDYVTSETGVSLYGDIWTSQTWDDVSVEDNLRKKAQESIDASVAASLNLTIKAIDLSLVDANIEKINVGQYVRVRSDAHSLYTTMLCTRKVIDIGSPENSEISLGKPKNTITSAVAVSTLAASNAVSKANSAQSVLNSLTAAEGVYA